MSEFIKCSVQDALAVENAALKAIVESVTDLDNEPEYHDCGMGCGLEDRGITDRYEAMHYGWDQAMERIYGEVIPSAEELNIETTATDAALRQIEARGVEKFAAWVSEQESMARGAGDKKEAHIYCQLKARAKYFAIRLREVK